MITVRNLTCLVIFLLCRVMVGVPQGGSLTVGFAGDPRSLYFGLAYEELSHAVSDLILEPLIEIDLETYQPKPALAKSWKLSSDKKEWIFLLDPRARFSDGLPVTAQDVAFTWEAIQKPENLTQALRGSLAHFGSCRVVDTHTVAISTDLPLPTTLLDLNQLYILPKHLYEKSPFPTTFAQNLVGSGAYRLSARELGQRIELKRDRKYWRNEEAAASGRHNFEQITFRIVPDYTAQFELFKRREIDYYYFLSARQWSAETQGVLFSKGLIQKLKAENDWPFSLQGIAWNQRKPLFQDRRVRLALSHLFNRDRFIRDLFFDNYGPCTGIAPFKSAYHSPNNTPVPFDPKAANKLLNDAGWKLVDGRRVKKGAPFKFSLLTDNPATYRYLTLYQQDLKEAGIQMDIQTLDYAAVQSRVDARQFDAVEVSQSRNVVPQGFLAMWGSEQANVPGSANVSGYHNLEADRLMRLIDQEPQTLKRQALVRKLDALIAHDQPMSFAWEPTFWRIAYWDRLSFQGKGYSRYARWFQFFQYWWADSEKEKLLEEKHRGMG